METINKIDMLKEDIVYMTGVTGDEALEVIAEIKYQDFLHDLDEQNESIFLIENNLL